MREHKDLLQKLSSALKIVSLVAGLLSFIPVLAPIMGPIALGAGLLAAGIDLAVYAGTGEGNLKMILIDVGLNLLPGVGKLARMGMGALRGTKVAMAFSGAMRGLGGIRSSISGLRTSALALGKRALALDPVDLVTGEMALWQTDARLPGVLGLVFHRTHLSTYRVGRWFGLSWASTVDQRLEVDADGICLAVEDGMLLSYPSPVEGEAVLPAEGPRWPLVLAAGGYTVTDPDRGRTLHFAPVEGWYPYGSRRVTVLPVVAITDRHGNRVDFRYNEGGVLREISHAGYRLGVDVERGLVTALRLLDTDEILVRYAYDADGRLAEVYNSSGLPLRFEYDEHGRIVQWVDRSGVGYRYRYDENGRCVATGGPTGHLSGTIAYDTDSTVVTDAQGRATTYYFNDHSQVERVEDPLGNTISRTWDRYDRLRAETDALGNTTTYEYDPAGNVAEVVRPDGARAAARYNDLRQPVELTDFNGATWLREYDERGNLLAVTDPTGARTAYEYSEMGHLVAVVDAAGNRLQVEVDAAGLPLSVTDAAGGVTAYERDGLGRVVAMTDALGGTARYGYTPEGKLAWRTAPDGSTDRFRYDAEGNLVESVDALGQRYQTEFGPFDLPVARIGADGTRVEFGYDSDLRLTSVTNPTGQVWRYAYDEAGRLSQETDFNGRTLSYEYDPAGRLVARTNGLGQRIRFVHDAMGNVVQKHTDDGVTTYRYDAAGRLIGATNADSHLTIERDALGRVLAEVQNGRRIESAYDALGRRVRRTTPSGVESRWEYGPTGRLDALRTAGQTVHFGYDLAGRETSRTVGDSVLAQAWDVNHRLLSQTLTGTQPLQRREYAYRPDGRLSTVVDQLAGTRELEFDPTGRITAVRGLEEYEYDAAGRIVGANWPGEGPTRGEREYQGTLIRRAGDTRYEYDAEGRVVRKRVLHSGLPAEVWHYRWTADDRLAGVTTPDGTRWRYRYDPLGRRIAKERMGADGLTVLARTEFVWDGTSLAEEVEGGRVTTWEWEPGSFRPLAQTVRRRLSQEEVDERFYAIVTDLTGQPVELVGADGRLAGQSRSTIWGAAPAGECPLRLPGQYRDAETGLHYNYHRYYDPDTARYQSIDPLGLAPAADPHGYVPNPVHQIDPLGLTACSAMSGPMRTVYRWGDRMNPNELLPKLASAPQHVQDDVARAMADPAWRAARAEQHAMGDTFNTPFISVAADPFRAVNTTDPWLASITQNAPDLAILRVPESSLIAPQNPLSLSESEMLFEGNDLANYLVKWIPNPFKV